MSSRDGNMSHQCGSSSSSSHTADDGKNTDDSSQTSLDQWFSSTIDNYDELMMLEVEYKPLKLSVGGRDSIYMLQEKAEDSQILSYYQLPDKIVSFRKNNVVKSSDLKIRAGTFLDTDIKQIHALLNEERLVASEVASPGLCLFTVNQDTDKLDKSPARLATTSNLISPHFCQLDDETLVLTKTVSDPSYSYNMAGKSLHRLKVDELSMSFSSSNLIPFALSRYSVALGVEQTGYTVIYDLRSHSPAATIQYYNAGSHEQSKLDFAASYRPITPYKESTCIVMVTDSGRSAVYDLRCLGEPLAEGKPTSCPSRVRMAPGENYFSVSDTFGIVGVFSFREEKIRKVFTHEGHNRVEGSCGCCNKTTDHVWFDHSTIISSADNNTVNIWQFIIQPDGGP